MLTREQQRLVIDRRYQGLPEIAHGGYVAGVLAGALGAADAEVRLKLPAPTGRRLTLEVAGGELAELGDGAALLARATPGELELELPRPVTPAEAEAASARYPGFRNHPFPGCLVCGTERPAGDGLRIFPGPVPGRRLVAARWVPTVADDAGHVPSELVWAALDCPQLWSLMVHAAADSSDLVLTAALHTRLEQPVVAGEPHVVMAWPIGRKGRAWVAGGAVIGPDGELRAIGRQTAAVAGWGVPLGRDLWAAAHNHNDTGEMA